MAEHMTEAEFLQRIANARRIYARERAGIEFEVLSQLPLTQQMAVERAVRGALARGAVAWSQLPERLVVWFQVLLVGFGGLVFSVLAVIACLAFHAYAPLSFLIASVYSGSALVTAALEVHHLRDEQWPTHWRALVGITSLMYARYPVRSAVYTLLGLASVTMPVLVLWRAAASHGVHSEFWVCSASILIGATAGFARPRIYRSLAAVLYPMRLASSRYRAIDQVVLSLAFCVTVVERARTARGDDRWSTPQAAREVISLLAYEASVIDDVARASARTPWRYRAVRAQVAEPYHAIADLLRTHMVAVASATTREEWLSVCRSLTAGLTAAASGDQRALLKNAVLRSERRRDAVLRVLRKLAPSILLALSAILLPIWISFGGYTASVRAVLIVSAVYGLLPESQAVRGTVTDTLFKALPFRGAS